MKVQSILLAGVAAALAQPVAAQQGEIQRGPVPEWVTISEAMPVPPDASGLVFVRRQDTLVRLEDEGQTTHQSQLLRILHPQALQAGNVGISWNPAVGPPVVHHLRVHRDGEVIDVLDATRFEILRQEEQLEQAMLHGMLTAVLRVPDLRVGDDIEFAYTIPSHDPTMGRDSSGLMVLADAPPPGRYRVAVSWSAGQEPTIRATPDLAEISRRGSDSFEIVGENLPAIVPPKDAPPRYGWMRIAEFSDFTDWQAVSRRLAPLYARAAETPEGSPVRQEAARIAGAHADPLLRAQAALRLVQQQVRYIYVGLDGGNLTPATAEETWQRRYGDCKGKTTLLLALLAELGIAAEAVLVNNSGGDDGLDQRLPSTGLFDHVLVRATIGGKSYWMDGTLPDVAEASLRPVVPYRWVLPLSAKGRAIEAIPFEPLALPDEMGLYEIDARSGFDAPARLTQRFVKRGIEGLTQYAQLSAATPDQLLTSFRGALAGSSTWDEIEKVEYRFDRATQASILTITGSGPVDWDDEGNGAYDLSLPGGGFSPPGRRQRSSDQDQIAPYYNDGGYSCHATTLRVPEGTDLQNWGFNTVFDTKIYGSVYYRMMEKRDDRTIRLVRGSRTEQREISAATAERDNARLARFDNSMANVSYDPAETVEPWGNLEPVPATYEFDWAGAAPPCLPEDLLARG
jgi:transglutaminase-like putative cysteine protease